MTAHARTGEARHLVRYCVSANIGGGQVPQVGECCGRSGTFRRPGHWQTLISAAATARWVFSCSADAGSWRAGAGGLLGVPRRDGVNYWNHIWREVPCRRSGIAVVIRRVGRAD